MPPKIALKSKLQTGENIIFLVQKTADIPKGYFTPAELAYINKNQEKNKVEHFVFNRLEYWYFVQIIKDGSADAAVMEKCRKAGDKLQSYINKHHIESVSIYAEKVTPSSALSLAEGLALGSYQFLKYKTEKKEPNSLKGIQIVSGTVTKKMDRTG